jgi:hypothetical protein
MRQLEGEIIAWMAYINSCKNNNAFLPENTVIRKFSLIAPCSLPKEKYSVFGKIPFLRSGPFLVRSGSFF